MLGAYKGLPNNGYYYEDGSSSAEVNCFNSLPLSPAKLSVLFYISYSYSHPWYTFYSQGTSTQEHTHALSLSDGKNKQKILTDLEFPLEGIFLIESLLLSLYNTKNKCRYIAPDKATDSICMAGWGKPELTLNWSFLLLLLREEG